MFNYVYQRRCPHRLFIIIALMVGLMLIAFCAEKLSNILTTPLARIGVNKRVGSIMILAETYLAISH